MTLSAELLRNGYAQFPSGVVAVCGRSPDGPLGMVVSTFIPVSLTPPLVAISVQLSSRTWPQLRVLPRIGLSILAEAHDREARALAAKQGDRFVGITHTTRDTGAVFIVGASGSFECSLESELPAGDHLLALLRVHDLDTSGAQPLVFHRSGFDRLSAGPPDPSEV